MVFPNSYLESLAGGPAHADWSSANAGTTLSSLLTTFYGHSAVLLCSSLKAPHHEDGDNDWHMAAVIRRNRSIYIFSNTFDPENPVLDPGNPVPRLAMQPGCRIPLLLLRVLMTPKTRTVSEVRNASDQAVKGRGLQIGPIYMTGINRQTNECIRDSVDFLYEYVRLGQGGAGVQGDSLVLPGYSPPLRWIQIRVALSE